MHVTTTITNATTAVFNLIGRGETEPMSFFLKNDWFEGYLQSYKFCSLCIADILGATLKGLRHTLGESLIKLLPHKGASGGPVSSTN